MPFKGVATILTLTAAGWFFKLWLEGKAAGGTVSILAWFVAALAMMAYTWVWILRSRTGLDAQALHQRWVWDKRMELADLAYGKLVRVRGLEWLIAPRLYVRTLAGKFAVFHAADPAVLAECERMLAELKAFRTL